MNKFKATLKSESGLATDGTYTVNDTFKVLPASVAGANGAMHRYASAMMITAAAHLVYSGEGSPPTLNMWNMLDWLIGRLTWTRYGGSFVPQPLTAREIVNFLASWGILHIDKEAITCWQRAWDGKDECDVYASIIVPTTPTMFSTVSSRTPTDAPWPAALLGASSNFTIQGWLSLLEASVDEDTTCPSGIHLEVSALCLDTPRVIVARPIEYRKFGTTDDPAVLPTTFCKLPEIHCTSADVKQTEVAAYLSNNIVPVVRVDGRQLSERMTGRVFEYADFWYRDDADRLLPVGVGAGRGGSVYLLRNPFEASKMILQPAGSTWQIEGIGNGQGSKVQYYYTMFYDPSANLVSYQLSQMGVDPGDNKLGNIKVNSNPRSGMSMTEEEQIGIPQTLGDDAFTD